ncbi:MAG: hypothetical protein IJI87_00655 [Mogibacterium sp.]|nr:hypothetical protein [Mogibacterium sp.]
MAKNKVVYGGQVLVDLTDATLEQTNGDQILEGQTAYGRDGEKITGTCTYNADTSDATASASEILATKTAYVNGNKLTGTMPNNGGTGGSISDLDTPYTIPAGYSDGSAEVGIDTTEAAKIIPGNIKEGVEILGVTGTYTGEGVTAQAKTVTPYTTQQVILPDAGYDYLSQVTVEAIYYNETANAYGTTVTIGTVAP